MKTPNGFEIIELFEQWSPKAFAMEGDPIGLQIGSLNKPVTKVMIALDVLDEVVDEAIERGVQLIIAHHPPIFRPLKNINTDQYSGRMIEKLIKHDIAVYAAHTNLDVAKGGVNDLLAEALGLEDTKVLVPTYTQTMKKLAVFCPEDTQASLRTALGAAGAGMLGNYSSCSFTSVGTGRFLPGENSNPAIGKQGILEEVKEVKIEVIYSAERERKVLSAMFKAHPYEEPAFDIFNLDNQGEKLGLGRIGKLKEEMTLAEFAGFVKTALDVNGVRFVGQPNATIKKVAVLGGDGNKYITQAKFSGADVYVTGDLYYHVAHDAMALDLNIVDPGHNVEKVMKLGVKNKMEKLCGDKGFKVEWVASEIHTDPFTFL
ncbi:Nif3-like dinuclear metal center hexameric protein [Peribacillus saganii]|uniref:GTP cyclohydrolase 1 type 2 homolog n=1 Tax=Peribacillus saganii TaxID=2303992 RepID=A0A372LU25_9BACI|nr:Nif3-like dinuclear metal center hexameric protein [Peribacillus saganii]RFU71705.1 Nif3-like dinuclear metal center hexameric protein [Peribacillus saganii]